MDPKENQGNLSTEVTLSSDTSLQDYMEQKNESRFILINQKIINSAKSQHG